MTREEAKITLERICSDAISDTIFERERIAIEEFVDKIYNFFETKPKALIVQHIGVKEIVHHLNQVCNTSYKHTSQKTATLIKARLKEGFTIDDFKKVHITKYAEWYGTDMQKYLRPETLYGTKFESYLNQAPTDYEKLNAITSHTGLTPLQFLKQQGFAE